MSDENLVEIKDGKIIIDGVDVSRCEHLFRDVDCLAHMDFSNCCEGFDPEYGYCPNIPDCYFKQLKSKEKECEELKALLENMNKIKTVSEPPNNIQLDKSGRLKGES